MSEIAALQNTLWQAMLASGNLSSPSEALQSAFFAAPRHQFINRYRTFYKPEWRFGPVEEIYTDVALILAGDTNDDLVSTCSMPSFILELVRWLDVRPGDNVLEVGSGCGWLVAILSQLAGPHGQVTGVEILPGLAEVSRRNLDGYLVTIHCGDGALGYPAHAPYDRVIFTAGAAEIPPSLHAQIKPGGRLLLPIRKDGNEASVKLFERQDDGFVEIGSRPGFFVPMRECA